MKKIKSDARNTTHRTELKSEKYDAIQSSMGALKRHVSVRGKNKYRTPEE